ncbi:MBL fold metallo-hydrolase [Sulfidibacter corallicola]|uniref:MBL fold metallo-hydrolase n=1 Tax=Sulfidibacter corallicola TaxID=2818388 RepID=A0A8A4TUX0_SULCO|nr:MBL fold metallo-hydrolase [Sulfidibacter corallicola]QTD53749.1 MBL fold metallo-hydrolase [Sulfidibacter corallicola]
MTLVDDLVIETTPCDQELRTTSTEVDFRLTVLGSGSSGNCSLVSSEDTHLLIDAGFSGKEVCARLERSGFDPGQLTAILVTHEHSDHVKSVHTLSRKFQIPIFSTNGTFAVALQDRKFYDWHEIESGRSFSLGGMCVHPISLPHDAADPIGFRIECGGRILGHITDFGYPSGLVMESLRGCDTLLIEANHDLEMLKNGPYPWSLKQRIASRLGHLSNESMLEMLPEILHDDVRQLVLAHLSDSNNDPRVLTLQMKRTLRRLGLEKIPFTLARQNDPTPTYSV